MKVTSTIQHDIEPIVFDTTLREGFQTPGGIGGSFEERVYVAALIQQYAHWVELGMPANNVDYQIISAIRDRFLQEKYEVGIAVLARCHELDIARAAEVMANYPNSLIHLFVGTSDEHRKLRFGGRDDAFYETLIMRSIEDSASRKEFARVMFSPEDAYRTFMQEPDRLIRFIKAAKTGYEKGNESVGRDEPMIFNLPDTVGYSTIYEFGHLIETVQQTFGDSIELSVHGHDDTGMAQAQAIDVYERYGVNWLQTTFGRLGERNGIASTDLVIKTLVNRGYLKDPRITVEANLRQLDPTTNAIMWTLGRQAPEEHLDRVNVSTAGIHTHLAVADSDTYHIYGDRFGSETYVELGPTSGAEQVKEILHQYDKDYEKSELLGFTDMLKKTANERKSPLSVTHMRYEAETYFHGHEDNGLQVKDYQVTTGRAGQTKLTASGFIDNIPFIETHESSGPVEVTMELLNRIINNHRGTESRIRLQSYRPRVIPSLGSEYLEWEVGSEPQRPRQIGKDAHLAISLAFSNGSGTYHGWARHQNSTVAEIEAVIDGMTKMYALQKWGASK
jgi:2-isopropylmalate synthase